MRASETADCYPLFLFLCTYPIKMFLFSLSFPFIFIIIFRSNEEKGGNGDKEPEPESTTSGGMFGGRMTTSVARLMAARDAAAKEIDNVRNALGMQAKVTKQQPGERTTRKPRQSLSH